MIRHEDVSGPRDLLVDHCPPRDAFHSRHHPTRCTGAARVPPMRRGWAPREWARSCSTYQEQHRQDARRPCLWVPLGQGCGGEGCVTTPCQVRAAQRCCAHPPRLGTMPRVSTRHRTATPWHQRPGRSPCLRVGVIVKGTVRTALRAAPSPPASQRYRSPRCTSHRSLPRAVERRHAGPGAAITLSVHGTCCPTSIRMARSA
jgi:hypothetical protein